MSDEIDEIIIKKELDDDNDCSNKPCYNNGRTCKLKIINKSISTRKHCKCCKKHIFDKGIINSCPKLEKFGNFDCLIVDTLGEYIKVINYLLRQSFPKDKKIDKGSNKKIRVKYVFRGLKRMEEFNSALKRKNKISEEFDYIKKFEENGCMKLGQFNNAIDMAAAARHYGVTSRLIDWSTSPLVATLFAFYEPCSQIELKNDNDNDNENNNIKDKKNNQYYGLVVRNYNESCLILHVLDVEEKYCNSPLNIQYRRMIEKYEELLQKKNTLFKYLGEKISIIPKSLNLQNEVDKLCAKYNGKTEKSGLSISNELKEAFTFVKNYFTNVYFNTNYVDIDKGLSDNDIEIINKMIRRFLKKDIKVYLETNFSNERLRNQRGVFEIDDVNNLFNCNNTKKIKAPKIILINKNARKEIIKHIDKLGINFYMLMDDPENTSKIINSTIDKQISFNSDIEYDN